MVGAEPVDARWRSALGWGAATYLASRLMVLAGAAVVPAAKVSSLIEADLQGRPPPGTPAGTTLQGIVDTLTAWDGRWYFELARS